jgi:hypothetical protein
VRDAAFADTIEGQVWASLAPLVQPSLAALLALCVVLVVSGRLVPVATVRRLLEAERRFGEQQKERAEELKVAGEAKDLRADALVRAVEELLPYARTADELVELLKREVDQGRTP